MPQELENGKYFKDLARSIRVRIARRLCRLRKEGCGVARKLRLSA